MSVQKMMLLKDAGKLDQLTAATEAAVSGVGSSAEENEAAQLTAEAQREMALARELRALEVRTYLRVPLCDARAIISMQSCMTDVHPQIDCAHLALSSRVHPWPVAMAHKHQTRCGLNQLTRCAGSRKRLGE